jgi:ABC-type lipoprotein release transport system permease subunit
MWRTFLFVGEVAIALAISITFVSVQNGFQDFLFNIIFQISPCIVISPLEGKDYLHLYRWIIDNLLIHNEIKKFLPVDPLIRASTVINRKIAYQSYFSLFLGLSQSGRPQIRFEIDFQVVVLLLS